MNDARIRTSIAPNLICCDGQYGLRHALREAEQVEHPRRPRATIIMWEPSAGPQDRRPTFREAVYRLIPEPHKHVRALCGDISKTRLYVVYGVLKCELAPKSDAQQWMAHLVDMAPEAIRWPIRVTESEATSE